MVLYKILNEYGLTGHKGVHVHVNAVGCLVVFVKNVLGLDPPSFLLAPTIFRTKFAVKMTNPCVIEADVV